MFVLIHGPVVGPLTWALVAEELERQGVPVVVPSLLPALESDSDFCRVIARCVVTAVEQS